jgi:hypothetical protein
MRLILLIFFALALAACKSGSGAERAKALMGEANDLLEQQSKITSQWAAEYGKVFSPQNRAQFPSNRNSLRTHADALIKLLDESSRLSNAAADKYEQASKLAGNDQERRGMVQFVTAMRNDVEVNELLKSQMRLVADEAIKDEQTFNEKFTDAMKLIQQKEKESEDHMNEGKRLLGL